MKKEFCKKIICILLFACLMILESCTVSEKKASEVENASEKKNISKLLSDDDFLNYPHCVQNPVTYTNVIVRGDGKILLNAKNLGSESAGLIYDMKTEKSNFVYKVFSGDKIEEHVYNNEYNGMVETYTEKLPSERTVFYDKDGNEVGLEVASYAAFRSFNDYILYYDNSVNIGETGLYIYDVKNKKSKKAPHGQVNFFNNRLIFSSSLYDKKDLPKETIIMDDDLNVIKTIEDYSFSEVRDYGGAKVGEVVRMVKKNPNGPDTDNYDDYTYEHNFVDENFNFLFTEPTTSTEYKSDKTIITMQSGNKEFDYDFGKKEKVSSDRPIIEKENKWQKRDNERKKFSTISEEIKNIDTKYEFVSTLVSGNKVLFQANYKNENSSEEDWRYKSDFYDINKKLLKTIDYINFVDEDLERIFADYDTVYDFDFNELKKFDRKSNIDKHEVKNKIYYSDGTNLEYMPYDSFTLYDEDLNPVFYDVKNVDFYSIKDRIIIVDEDGTIICDENLKEIKSLDRKLKFSNWYDVPYMSFEDMDSKLCGIVDENLNIVVDNIKKANDLKKKYFTYQNGFKYGLMDYEGNAIFSYSIFDTMSEDSVREDYEGNFVE